MNPFAFIRSTIVVIFLFPLWTALVSALNILHNIVWGNRRVNDLFIYAFCRVNCLMFGVKLVTFGAEHIPKGTCLILFNHTSFFDIFAIQSIVMDVRFGAKIELFKVPIFGPAMRAIGVLPIARGNLESVLKVYKAAESRAAAGEKFALAPEGGRNASPDRPLLPFKSGPFLFAVSAQTPILPIVVKGAREVWPKGHLIPATKSWNTTIEIHFMPLIPVAGYTPAQKNILQAQTFEAMAKKMVEINY